jgi:pimeloyl-ACP methyl ester carboxylesterase
MALGDVLLVHGSLQSSRVWAKHGYLAQLCGQYRVTTIDVRGHGVSDKPQEAAGYDIRASVSDVCAVLDRLGIDKTHYIGYSLGGRIGLTLAATAPGRLLSLVVAGASHRPQRGAVDRLIFPGAASVADEYGLAAFAEMWESYHGVAMGRGFWATIAALGSRGLAAMLQQWDAEPGVPDEVLSQIDTPTLFFAGSQDPLRLADSRDAAARMPNASSALLEGCDHRQTVAMCEPILAQALPFFQASEFSGIELAGVAR